MRTTKTWTIVRDADGVVIGADVTKHHRGDAFVQRLSEFLEASNITPADLDAIESDTADALAPSKRKEIADRVRVAVALTLEYPES